MKIACELVSEIILPSIRAWIAREAIEKFGMKQKDVAKYLGITKAAVSQYVSKKRGVMEIGDIERKQITPLIEDLSRKIASNKISEFELMRTLCEICRYLKVSLTLCRLHMKIEPELERMECKFCEEIYK